MTELKKINKIRIDKNCSLFVNIFEYTSIRSIEFKRSDKYGKLFFIYGSYKRFNT